MLPFIYYETNSTRVTDRRRRWRCAMSAQPASKQRG